MKDDLFAERMAHTTTMLLTVVAFTFVVNSSLPVVPYMTYLDSYISDQFMFTFLTGLMACCPEIFPNFNDYIDSFKLAVIALSGWVLMHGFLLLDG